MAATGVIAPHAVYRGIGTHHHKGTCGIQVIRHATYYLRELARCRQDTLRGCLDVCGSGSLPFQGALLWLQTGSPVLLVRIVPSITEVGEAHPDDHGDSPRKTPIEACRGSSGLNSGQVVFPAFRHGGLLDWIISLSLDA